MARGMRAGRAAGAGKGAAEAVAGAGEAAASGTASAARPRSRANAVLGAAIALVAAVAIGWLATGGFGAADAGGAADAVGYTAIVHDADGNAYELPLAEDARITVTTGLGTNVVAVEDGAVRVAEADCANHDCIRQGAIDAPGRQVICLPHELWIEVVADGGESGQMDVDAVAGSGAADAGDAGEGLDAVAR